MLTKAKAIVSASLTPASDRDLLLWLAAMAQLIRLGAIHEEDLQAKCLAYVAQLRAYPADIVRAALTEWPAKSQFWPTWCELKPMLDEKLAHREALIGALEHPALPAPDTKASWLRELERTDPARAAILGGAPYEPPMRRTASPPRPLATQGASEDPAEREAMRAAAAAKLRALIESEGEGATP